MRVQTIALIAIRDQLDRLLLLKRPDHVHCAGLWSLPGGKIHTGEKAMVAAARELHEETGLSGSHWRLLGTHSHTYPDRRLSFLLFSCRCEDLHALECESRHGWFELNKLHELPMPEANGPLIEILLETLVPN